MPSSEKEILYIIIAGSALFILVCVFFVYFLFQFQNKNNSHIREKEAMRFNYQKTLLQSQLEIQEQTLKNISQEIHDNIGQALSLAKLNMNTMLPVSDDRLYQKIINSKELISKAISDLRDLSRSLDTDYVKEMGLQRAIEYELEIMQKTETIETNIQVEGTVVRLDKQKELILFRIIQETFHNIIKHAEAKLLLVDVLYEQDQLTLKIVDDGKGMDINPAMRESEQKTGLGLRNMKNRAKLIGADFLIDSTPRKGTKVQIVLPFNAGENENT